MAAWFLLLFYLPGEELILARALEDSPWYWWLASYLLYGQALLAIVLLITAVIPAWISLRLVIGHTPTAQNVRFAMTVTVFLFFVSWASAYLVFLPLSYILPDFVSFWIIDVPRFISYDSGSYPVVANILNLLSLCVLAPILEEFAFRGIILRRWSVKFGLRNAIFASSLVFAIVHPHFLGAFLFGIAMCILYLRTQSLLIPIMSHGIYNFALWLIEIGYIVVEGPNYEYTLDRFQNQWVIGLIATAIVAVWAWLYYRKAGVHKKLRFPK